MIEWFCNVFKPLCIGNVTNRVAVVVAVAALILSGLTFFIERRMNRKILQGQVFLNLRERYGKAEMFEGLRALGQWWRLVDQARIGEEVRRQEKLLNFGDATAVSVDAGRRVVKRYFEDAYHLKRLRLLSNDLFGLIKAQAGVDLLEAVWHLDAAKPTATKERLESLRKVLEAYDVEVPEG